MTVDKFKHRPAAANVKQIAVAKLIGKIVYPFPRSCRWRESSKLPQRSQEETLLHLGAVLHDCRLKFDLEYQKICHQNNGETMMSEEHQQQRLRTSFTF